MAVFESHNIWIDLPEIVDLVTEIQAVEAGELEQEVAQNFGGAVHEEILRLDYRCYDTRMLIH